jgi:3-hydroxybutyryl-CoA dehydratase
VATDFLKEIPSEFDSKEVTEVLVKLFAKISGDRNPYHLDKEYASQSRYQSQIGHGVLTVGLALEQISKQLPTFVPENLEVSRFTAPVRFGDRVRVILTEARTASTGEKLFLKYTVKNQDDVAILDGNVRLRPRVPSDGFESWASALGQNVGQLMDAARGWSRSVEPFPARPAPKLLVGDNARYETTFSNERLGATTALFEDSPWMTALVATQAIAQASAEFSPGFILVGLEVLAMNRPPDLNETLSIDAVISRQGTLAHRPLDRIRIDVTASDSKGVVYSGSVYKESELPVEPTPLATSGPYFGSEFLVPATGRMFESFVRMYLPPHVTLLDMRVAGDAEDVKTLIELIRSVSPEKQKALQNNFLFLQSAAHGDSAIAKLTNFLQEIGDKIDGVVFTDLRDSIELTFFDQLFGTIEKANGWTSGRIKIEFCYDGTIGLIELQKMFLASSRVVGVVVTNENVVLEEILQDTQSLEIDLIDGISNPNSDTRNTALGAIKSAMFGFHRKQALNPVHLNAILNPKLYLSQSEMEAADIPQEWITQVMEHDLHEGNSLWPEKQLARKTQNDSQKLFSPSELESIAKGTKSLD